jgi:hypothetical protein
MNRAESRKYWFVVALCMPGIESETGAVRTDQKAFQLDVPGEPFKDKMRELTRLPSRPRESSTANNGMWLAESRHHWLVVASCICKE